MPSFFATFGTGHAYSGCYVEIIAEDHHAARAHMIREHGERWGTLYVGEKFTWQIDRFGLVKMVTVRQREGYPNDRPFFDVVKDGTNG